MTATDLPPPVDTSPSPSGPAGRARRLRVAAALLAVLGAVGFLVSKGLGDATVYFKTADEAVREKETLGTRRFRVEGVVLDDVVQSGDAVRFTIEEKGAKIAVRHAGDPPELFRPGIPVVLEGHWQGDVYESDRIMVKHTNEYREKNPERVGDYVGR